MLIDRRAMLGMAATAAVAGALPAWAAGSRDYDAALAALRAYAKDELEAVGLPGMTISIVDDAGFATTLSVGLADVARGVPVRPDQLFQIGSISKSITSLALHAMASKGQVDLDAPVSRYLKGVPLPTKPITLWQLMNHAGGFAHDAPVFPRTPDGRLWSGLAPGSRFSYSNIGYMLLGMVIEAVSGRPHPEVIRELVLAPLGMTTATAHLLVADRERYATGYVAEFEDRVQLTQAPVMPGPFTERDFASGAVAASATDMIGYLRYVLALGKGRGGPVMSDAQAGKLIARQMPNDEFGPGSLYASGFATVPIDGRPALHHTGGMILFSSSFHADPAAGVACFASVNGRLVSYRPRRTTAYAVQLMRAVREGKPLPKAPDPRAFRAVASPTRLAGRYVAADGRTLELATNATGLVLTADGKDARVEATGKDALATDHAAYAAHAIQYAAGTAAVAQLWWGDTLFARDAAAVQPTPDPALLPYAGTYNDGEPWTRATVFVRGRTLHLAGVGEIVRRRGGFWSPVADPGGVTRIWFDRMVNGRTYEMSFCGAVAQRLA